MSDNDEQNKEQSARPIVGLEELQSLPLDDILVDGNTIDCYDIHTQLRAAAVEYEKAESKLAPALNLLSAICCIHNKFDDPSGPYGPMLQNKDSRTIVPSDLKGEQTTHLAAFVPSIKNPSLKARIADIAWLNDRKRRDLAETAIESYARRVDQYLNGEARFEFELKSAIDFRAIDLLKRSFQISKSIKGKSDHPETVLGPFLRMFELAFSSKDLGSIVRVTRLGLDFGIVDEHALSERLEAFLSKNQDTDPQTLKSALEELQRIYRRNSQADKANDCQLRIAECSVAVAEAMAGSSMASAHWLMTAIGELRQAKGPMARDRAKELRKSLKDKQEDTLFEMGVVSHSTDISELVKEAVSRVSGLSLGEALGAFATLHRPSDPDVLQQQAKQSMAKHPLSSMFGGTHVDADGKVIAKSEGASLGEEAASDALRNHILRDMQMLRGLVVRSAIEPVRRHIQTTHPLTENAFEILSINSPFVPRYHEEMFSRGFTRFFEGDMISAGSLLIPQLENSMRYLLKVAGRDPSTIESDLTQDDRSISNLLIHERPALVAIFGEDNIFEIDALFNSRPGPALRHEIAHGKLSSGHYYGDTVIYACWFIFRLTCLPLFEHWDEVCLRIDGGAA